VPNYQSGKDSAAGFKLDYKGEIVEETYMPSARWISRLNSPRSLREARRRFTFMPGGMGVTW